MEKAIVNELALSQLQIGELFYKYPSNGLVGFNFGFTKNGQFFFNNLYFNFSTC